MTDIYKIYLVNQSAELQNFWCFLAFPPEMGNDSYVYANSNVSLPVPRYFTGTCQFEIPINYVFGAGAGSQAVGPGAEIVSSSIASAHLGDTWYAAYADAPPKDFPTLTKTATEQKPCQVSIETNAYDLASNDKAGWFSNQSFGIQSETMFLGMTWKPFPATHRILSPKATFLVTTGDFGSNRLASLDQITGHAATLDAPASFDPRNVCTVTFTRTGEWAVTEGPPGSSCPD